LSDILSIGEPPIEVEIRRSKRARRLSLRVSGLDGKVSLTIPMRGSKREAVAFLREKETWIRGHLAKRPEASLVAIGEEIPIEGQMRLIQVGAGRAVRLEQYDLFVPPGDDKAARRVQAFLKTMARDRLAEASEKYANLLGRPFNKISLRDTRSRWGSCTTDGNLMYSWRLILAPVAVLEYVAAHEVSHLSEMNHSPAFWAEVARLMPGYQAPRKWLKQHGSELHRFRFSN
jgi:predicted metal-dependent hydrolase